jgi:hypothetical protein
MYSTTSFDILLSIVNSSSFQFIPNPEAAHALFLLRVERESSREWTLVPVVENISMTSVLEQDFAGLNPFVVRVPVRVIVGLCRLGVHGPKIRKQIELIT